MSPREKEEEGITTQEDYNSNDSNSNRMAPKAAVDGADPREASSTREDNDDESTAGPTCWERLVKFYWDNEFVILVVIVILLARAYPPLGATYLYPEITATWIAVIFIFGTLLLS